MPTSPPSVEYELTELGRELLPAIDAIIRVGSKLALREGHERPRRRGARAVDSAAPSATIPR
jgi:DNA-binding HxlR family transcriptional regulator